MAVKILITLEGTEQINSALDAMSAKGEDFMKTFQSLGAGGQSPLSDVAVQLQTASSTAGEGLNKATDAAHGFAEALRIILPGLRLAGVEVGNFAGFARLASVGVEALAVAITGAVIVALANLEETASRTQSTLSGLFGSQALGGQAFSAIQESASALQTTVGGLAPIFQAATTALQRFIQTQQGFKFVALQGIDLPAGLAGNIKSTTDAISSLIKIIRAGGQDEATAEKSALSFFNTIKEGGKLTAEALKQMDPGAVRLLAEALGKGAISSEQFINEVKLAPIPITTLLSALDRFGPGAQQAFETTGIRSFKDALQDLLNTLSSGFKTVSGISFSAFIIRSLDDISKGIKDSIKQFNDFKNSIKQADAELSNLPFVKAIVDGLNALQKKAEEAGAAVRAALNLTGPGGAFGGNTEEIQAVWKGIEPPPGLADKFKKVGDDLGGSFKSVPESVAKVSDDLRSAVAKMPSVLTGAFSGTTAEINKVWAAGMAQLPEETNQAIDKTGTIIVTGISQLASKVEGTPIGQALVGPLIAIFDSLPSHVQAAIRNLPSIFKQLGADIDAGFTSIEQGAAAIGPRISAAILGIGPALGGIWTSIVADAKDAADKIKAFFATPIDFSKFLPDFQGAWNSAVTAAQTARDAIVSFFITPINLSGFLTGFQTAWDAASRAAQAAKDTIVALFTDPIDLSGFLSAFQAAWTAAVAAAQVAKDAIVAFFTTPIDLSSFLSGFQSAWQTVISSAQSAYSNIVSIFANPINVQFSTSGATGIGGAPFASGGLVTGPGTGTSDSILALLSNKEFVLNAKATSFYGPDLLHALNSMRIPRDMFPGFSMGGLVRAMATTMPHLAGGGQVAGVPVTFVIDRQRFNVSATEDTVKALSRFAVNSQISSAGRKPSWVR